MDRTITTVEPQDSDHNGQKNIESKNNEQYTFISSGFRLKILMFMLTLHIKSSSMFAYFYSINL